MNTKQVIALAALTVAGSAAMAQQAGAAVAPLQASLAGTPTAAVASRGQTDTQVVTVRATPYRNTFAEIEGLVPSYVAPASTLTRAEVRAEVVAAQKAGQTPFVDEAQGYRLPVVTAKSSLTRTQVQAEVLNQDWRKAFASEYLAG